ncbi:uncharacterized protein LOC111715954, partial [Eurytemora carolleeae]|uniref:uncharacterized protein LOC111715954 n=1 Tax=Eurytemora carolleeae TaxID=1294199 RepID=UPI000C76A623
MAKDGMWVGGPEWTMVAEVTGRPIVVFSPEVEKNMMNGWYKDVYLPSYRHTGSPLLIKSIPNHFQALKVVPLSCLELCLSGLHKGGKKKHRPGKMERKQMMEEIEVVLDTDLPAEFVNVGPCQFDASRSTTHSQDLRQLPYRLTPASKYLKHIRSMKDLKQCHRRLKKFSSCSRAVKYTRLRKLYDICEELAGGEHTAEVIQYLKDFSDRLNPKESVDPRVSEEEVLRMVHEAHLSYTSLWKIKSFLCRKNLDFLPSKARILKKKKQMEMRVPFEVGKMFFFSDTKCKDGKLGSFFRTSNLVEHSFSHLAEYDEEDLAKIDGKPVLIISGDKGGSVQLKANTMKLHTSIMLKDNGQGAGQLSLYGVFEGQDHHENLARFHEPLNEALCELQKTFKVGLQGDLAFTSAFQGHQGQAAWNCSLFSYSEKPHLLEGHKDGSPHNVSNPACIKSVTLRTVKEMEDDYQANVLSKKGLRAEGMFHGSIIGKMIFKPVENILQVKCSQLHLFMGVASGLVDKFENNLEGLDRSEEFESQNKLLEKDLISEEIEKKQEQLKQLDLEHRRINEEVIDLKNILLRRTERANNEKHAKILSSIRVKRKRVQCSSDDCIITGWDDASFIKCSFCFNELHLLCEGTSSVILQNTDTVDYQCVRCREIAPEVVIQEEIEQRENLLREKMYEGKISNLGAEIILLTQRHDTDKGPRVTLFLDALKSMSIDRSTFLPGVMLGRHLSTFLKRIPE